MFDLADLLAKITIAVAILAFVGGVLLTVFTGNFRAFRITLIALSATLGIALVIGMVVTVGRLIFLTFQLLSVIFIVYLLMLAGAVCGYGLFVLIHKKPPGKKLQAAELDDYLPATEFAVQERIDEERALSRIKSGYYQGGLFQGVWYIHKTELSSRKPA